MATNIGNSMPSYSLASSVSITSSTAQPSRAEKMSSGTAIMLERLWRITDPTVSAPAVKTVTTTSMTNFNTADFLTTSDRKFLEKVYTWASENKQPLEQVDALAADMAMYRLAGPSGPAMGSGYTADGKWIIPAFDERDSIIADRLQSSLAIASTELDHGFLSKELDPNSMQHAVDFAFLEKVVHVFSDQADKPINVATRPKDPNKQYAAPGQHYYLSDVLPNGQKPPTHPDNLGKSVASSGQGGSDVLSYLTAHDRKQLLQGYQMLMSLGMSTDLLDKTANNLGASRMREATGQSAPVSSTLASTSASHKATRAYSSQNSLTSLLDTLSPANRQKNRQPVIQMSKVLEKLLMAEKAEQAG